MPKVKFRLDADAELYAAADRALRALREDLFKRARESGDYKMVVRYGERLLRHGGSCIAQVEGLPLAAERAYRVADELVAASAKEAAV